MALKFNPFTGTLDYVTGSLEALKGKLSELTSKKHHELEAFDEFDDHTQYAKRTGRAGGQELIGGTAASDNLKLESNSSATKTAISIETPFTIKGTSNLSPTILVWNSNVTYSAAVTAMEYPTTGEQVFEGLNSEFAFIKSAGKLKWTVAEPGEMRFFSMQNEIRWGKAAETATPKRMSMLYLAPNLFPIAKSKSNNFDCTGVWYQPKLSKLGLEVTSSVNLTGLRMAGSIGGEKIGGKGWTALRRGMWMEDVSEVEAASTLTENCAVYVEPMTTATNNYSFRSLGTTVKMLHEGSGEFGSLTVKPRAGTFFPYKTEVLADSPVSYWRIDDAGSETEGTAADQQKANEGKYHGTIPLAAGALEGSGDKDKAGSCSGATANFISIPTSASLELKKEFTVEAWVWPEDLTGFHGIFEKSVGGVSITSFDLGLVEVNAFLRIVKGGEQKLLGGTVKKEAWSHIVGTFAPGIAKIYINGALSAETAIAAGEINSGAGVSVIGAFTKSETEVEVPLKGRVDEVAVYKTALSATRIKEHYESALQNYEGLKEGEAKLEGKASVGKTLELKELPVTQATPTEVPAAKTYEVPANTQALWKDNISVQGTLNVQGRFDEAYTIEPESVETEQIRNKAVTEAKVGPEIVTLAGTQTLTGEKKINKLKTEGLTFEGSAELLGLKNAALTGGVFTLGPEERFTLGSNTESTLKQVKLSGIVENTTEFETAASCAYAVIPEGGAAVLESAKVGTSKHRVVCIVNVSTTETLTIVHEGKGTAPNRFHFASGESVKLEPGQSIMLWYTEGEASGAAERWRDVGGASLNLRSFTNGIPTEIAAGKTYEVPATIQDLWKDNVSIQGTLNIQGRFDEVYTVEPSSIFAEQIAPETIGATQIFKGAISTEKLAAEAVTFPKMGLFSPGIPTEVATGKTYEVPTNISALWRDNISVQGTMNVQGRLTEV